MALLRWAGVADVKLGVISERIRHLLDTTNQEITISNDMDIQPRLATMYEEVQRLVDELVELGSIRDHMEQIYSKTPPADMRWKRTTAAGMREVERESKSEQDTGKAGNGNNPAPRDTDPLLAGLSQSRHSSSVAGFDQYSSGSRIVVAARCPSSSAASVMIQILVPHVV